MRSFVGWGVLFFLIVPAVGQGTPPLDPSHPAPPQIENEDTGTPPTPPASTVQQMTTMIKEKVNQAIEGRNYPSLDQWQPLSTKEKFQLFLRRSYSPRTFESTGIDALKDTIRNDNPEYERRFMGLGQHYGVDLGTSETEVFFEQFLMPSILRQDPRYFRNPSLPFTKRAIYSLSRVFVTHADSGHETFNASRMIGGAAAQSLADLYVPGQEQGLHPIVKRVTFDLARDAVFNLVHEFWPDVRRKFLHR